MADDIKLLRSQRLTDNPDGGGLATATEIVDGEINNLFDDVSRIDRVNGDVSLRKFFLVADTQDDALFSGLHVIVQSEPLDPRVDVVLFRTQGWGDVRAEAQGYVERYLDESVPMRMVVYDRQLVGQRTIMGFQRPELSLPEIGEVYALKNDTTGQREFVKVQDVTHQEETFTDERGDWQARVITLTISQPLTQEFVGSQPNRFFQPEATRTILRRTIPSDAARYKGIVRLAQNAQAGDLAIKVETVFSQLVPAATSEVAVTDARPAGAVVAIPSATLKISRGLFLLNSNGLYLPTPVMPGSVSASLPFGDGNVVDDGAGKLVNAASNNALFGYIDYDTGLVRAYYGTGVVTFNYLPAVHVAKAAHSWLAGVTLGNRGYVYAPVLRPLPSPGGTQVHYRALGRWYVLQDDGSGALVGEPGTGSGKVNFLTGSAPATLGALPDVGSAVIYNYGTAGEYEARTGDLQVRPPAVRFTLEAGNCEPGTLQIEWYPNWVVTDDGAGNLMSGATNIGRVGYGTGEVQMRPPTVPPSNIEFEATYDAGTTEAEVFTPATAGGSIVLTLGQVPRPGSVSIATVGYGQSKIHRVLRDNGSGAFVDAVGTIVPGSGIVYATGVVTLPAGVAVRAAQIDREAFAPALPSRQVGSGGGYTPTGVMMEMPRNVQNQMVNVDWINGTATTVTYKRNDAVDTERVEYHALEAMELDLLPGVRNTVVPGGVFFRFANREYFDRNGSLYYGMVESTGAGTLGGSIDYATGIARLTSWNSGQEPTLQVLSLLTEVAPLPMAIVHGRTPGSPLRPSTFTLTATRYRDSAALLAIADQNGNIDTPEMHGWVDVTTGVFSVAFGQYVLDSSLTADDKAEPWYNAAHVDADGWIWRPDEVFPGSIRFNCVVQVSVPIDPEIIGVNPVRLPSDGRVPVIRRGDTLVVQDAQAYPLAPGLTAGQVVTLPRTGLGSVALYDTNGLGVPRDRYAADLAAGTLTMATPLDLAGYVQPLVAIHAVEDMALCLDAQITGEIQLSTPLTHDYDADNSTLSSALLMGDVQARYGFMFTQATWGNVWRDTIIGDPPASGARYNDALFPLVLVNADTITERWRLTFTSATTFVLVGEKLGQIETGTTAADLAPINSATGQPYFTLRADGFGSGYGTGNTIRFNTYAAGGPVWAARTVLSGVATETDDRVRIQQRWDKD